MGETYVPELSVDVYAKMAASVHWRRKETVPRIHEVAVHTQPAVGRSTQEPLGIADEVSIGVEQANRPVQSDTAPYPYHEGAVQVRLCPYEQVVCNSAAEERTGSCLLGQLGEKETTRTWGGKQFYLAATVLRNWRLLSQLKPGFVLREHRVFLPTRPNPWRVANLEVEAAVCEN